MADTARARALFPLAVFALSFALFMANGREVSSPDTLPARYLPLRILRGSLDLAPIPFFAASREEYYAAPRGAAVYSPSPIATAVLATPVYAPVVLVAGEPDEAGIDRLSKLAAALLAAGGAAALATARLPHARLGAVLFACATPAWSIASQGLWMHAGATPAMAAALALATRGRPALAGVFAGIAVAARPALAPAVGAFGLLAYAGFGSRAAQGGAPSAGPGPAAPLRASGAAVRDLAVFAAGPIVFFGLVLLHDWALFGRPFGGHPEFTAERPQNTIGAAFGASMLQGVAGLLASPSRGLLFFAPWLLLGIGPAALALRRGATEAAPAARWYRAAAAASLAILLVHAKYRAWWGGWSYGPRYLTDAAPLLAVLAAPALVALWRAPRGRPFGPIAAALLAGWSAAAQAVGAFCFSPEVWNMEADVDAHPERAFTLRRSQIATAIAAGPARRGYYGHDADVRVAWWHLAAGRREEARRAALRAAATNPYSPRPDTVLGQIAAIEGDRERARAHYVRALTIDPGFAPAAVLLEATREPRGSGTPRRPHERERPSAEGRGRASGRRPS